MTLSVGNRLCTGPRLTGQCKINHFAIISLHLPHDSDARRRPRRRVAAGLERRRRLAAGGPPPDSAPAIADATLAGQLPPPPSPLYGARCRGGRGSRRLRWSTPPQGGPGPECRAGMQVQTPERAPPLWSLDQAARESGAARSGVWTGPNQLSQLGRPLRGLLIFTRVRTESQLNAVDPGGLAVGSAATAGGGQTRVMTAAAGGPAWQGASAARSPPSRQGGRARLKVSAGA
jgi:hypothetical protein